MFDEESQLDEPLALTEHAQSQQFAARGQDDEHANAFDDVLNDPLVSRVAPAELIKRKQVSKQSLRHVPVGGSVPIQSSNLMPAERVYVPAMGPRPRSGAPAVALSGASESDSTFAGMSVLAVGLGGAYGATHWGWRGGAAGALGAGGLVNVVRASKCYADGNTKEALISATFAAVGVGLATWIVLGAKKGGKKGQDDE